MKDCLLLLLRRVEGYDDSGDPVEGEAIGIAEYTSPSDDIHLKKWNKMDTILKAKYLDWSWEYITQAEFETYRDLHALKDYTPELRDYENLLQQWS